VPPRDFSVASQRQKLKRILARDSELLDRAYEPLVGRMDDFIRRALIFPPDPHLPSLPSLSLSLSFSCKHRLNNASSDMTERSERDSDESSATERHRESRVRLKTGDIRLSLKKDKSVRWIEDTRCRRSTVSEELVLGSRTRAR